MNWKKIFYNLFVKNFHYKLSALILTIFLWIFISYEKDLEIGIKARLAIKTAQGYVVSGNVPSQIDIRVAGPKILLQNLFYKDLVIDIDLTDAKEGYISFSVPASKLDLPWGVDVLSIYPSNIVAKISKVSVKKVKVMPAFEGKLPLGYYIKETKIDPEYIEVFGAEDDLNNLEVINTEPISLGNITEAFTIPINIKLPSEKMFLKDKQTANVTVVVLQEEIKKEFKEVKVGVKNCALTCRINPSKALVILKGSKSVLENISDKDITIYIDASYKAKGTYLLKAVLKLPAKTVLERIEPISYQLIVY